MKKTLLIFGMLLVGLLTFGQDNKEYRKIRPMLEKGMIISSPSGEYDDTNYDKSKTSYDMTIVGVYTGNEQPRKITDYVRSEGIIEILINDENGIIKRGDIITSSSIPGEGMKATKSGMTVGIAMEDATESKSLVKCRIFIQYKDINIK